MTPTKLREALANCNLCRLERLSGVSARTLRRIRNTSNPIRASTIETVVPHLAAARCKRDENARRMERSIATRKGLTVPES